MARDVMNTIPLSPLSFELSVLTSSSSLVTICVCVSVCIMCVCVCGLRVDCMMRTSLDHEQSVKVKVEECACVIRLQTRLSISSMVHIVDACHCSFFVHVFVRFSPPVSIFRDFQYAITSPIPWERLHTPLAFLIP